MTFETLKPEISEALNQKIRLMELKGETQGFTIVDGFVMQSLQNQTAGISIGGKSVPTVLVVGNSTGRIYHFALKALLPNITL